MLDCSRSTRLVNRLQAVKGHSSTLLTDYLAQQPQYLYPAGGLSAPWFGGIVNVHAP